MSSPSRRRAYDKRKTSSRNSRTEASKLGEATDRRSSGSKFGIAEAKARARDSLMDRFPFSIAESTECGVSVAVSTSFCVNPAANLASFKRFPIST